MRIFIEGEYYDLGLLEDSFDDDRYYGRDGKILAVGYYHAADKSNLVFMLPKVFMSDNKCMETGARLTVWGCTSSVLVSRFEGQYSMSDPLSWIRNLSVDFYRSLMRYRKRHGENTIEKQTLSFNLRSNLGENEYSYLDLLQAFVDFYRRNRDAVLLRYIQNTSSSVNRVSWAKTVRCQLPVSLAAGPVYPRLKIRKSEQDNEDELITAFMSILHYFDGQHMLGLRINKTLPIIKGKEKFEQFRRQGLLRLKKIRYKYFSDLFLRMYRLCELFFTMEDRARRGKKKYEYLIATDYQIVFEDMMDCLLSEDFSEQTELFAAVEALKQNRDGKIIDHLYRDASMMDCDGHIFHIADSKYYKPGNVTGDLSNYKQFTYARNIIQYNIDALNNACDRFGVRYRDPVTEGYDITPNFFIHAYLTGLDDFTYDGLQPYGRPVENCHFPGRLFDRDTLFVLPYRINFLYVLHLYAMPSMGIRQKEREKLHRSFREHFRSYLFAGPGPQSSGYLFYRYPSADLAAIKSFCDRNFRLLSGHVFMRKDGTLIAAARPGKTASLTMALIREYFTPYNPLD